ncbi:HIT family protein [Candidatus Pacearchaeota archaeon]|nr:HIT family protein [Candidatus Pacearchaeota archaeon]
MECIFCKIAQHEVSAYILYEDEQICAFLDLNPVNPGHTLVIPKQHYSSLSETPDAVVPKIFSVVKKLQVHLKERLQADFVAVSIIGLDVPHVHVHLVPRYKEDGMANFWPTKTYAKGEAEDVLKKITLQ